MSLAALDLERSERARVSHLPLASKSAAWRGRSMLLGGFMPGCQWRPGCVWRRRSWWIRCGRTRSSVCQWW